MTLTLTVAAGCGATGSTVTGGTIVDPTFGPTTTTEIGGGSTSTPCDAPDRAPSTNRPGVEGTAATRKFDVTMVTDVEAISPCPSTTQGTAPRRGLDLPADRVVWQVESGGGFVPAYIATATRPSVTVYGDGRAFLIDQRSALDGHAPTIQLGRITPDELQRFLSQVDASGLFDGTPIPPPEVTDLGDTEARAYLDGKVRAVSAYALAATFDHGLPGDAIRRRRRLRTLISASQALVLDLQRWTPERLAVIEARDGADTRDGPPPPPWPGPPLAQLLRPTPANGLYDRCGIVSGDQAATVLAADAATVHTRGRWEDQGTWHTLVLLPLLPGEAGCGR